MEQNIACFLVGEYRLHNGNAYCFNSISVSVLSLWPLPIAVPLQTRNYMEYSHFLARSPMPVLQQGQYQRNVSLIHKVVPQLPVSLTIADVNLRKFQHHITWTLLSLGGVPRDICRGRDITVICSAIAASLDSWRGCSSSYLHKFRKHSWRSSNMSLWNVLVLLPMRSVSFLWRIDKGRRLSRLAKVVFTPKRAIIPLSWNIAYTLHWFCRVRCSPFLINRYSFCNFSLHLFTASCIANLR